MPLLEESRPKTCVVVSYWTEQSPKPLYSLLNQMLKVDAGSPFDLVICGNGGDKKPFTLPRRFDKLRPRILLRENLGYNIAAWDHAWRLAEGYEYYLFIQDDCYLKTPMWLSRFELRFEEDAGVGLLGEFVASDQMTWEYVRKTAYYEYWTDPSQWPTQVHPIEIYKELFDSRQIPWTGFAGHIPSIILFTSRKILEEIDGFPYFGPSKREAITSELAISRLVESKGYRISKVTGYPFEIIGHPQWWSTGRGRHPGWRGLLHEALWRTKTRIRFLIGPKRKLKVS